MSCESLEKSDHAQDRRAGDNRGGRCCSPRCAAVHGGGGMETTEERTAYLASLGWEVDAASETGRDVVLPEELDGRAAAI